MDLGDILNDVSIDNVDPTSSQIQVMFDVQALPHDEYEEGSPYRVSVGALYQSESFVSVAQDDLKYAAHTEQVCLNYVNSYVVLYNTHLCLL